MMNNDPQSEIRQFISLLDEPLVYEVELEDNPTRKKWERSNKIDDERKVVIDDSFWQDFELLARVCYLHDPEATIYDVFDIIRTKVLGGWEYSSEFLAQLDAEIEQEEQRNAGRTRDL